MNFYIEWFFSGIGVLLITLLIDYFRRKRKKNKIDCTNCDVKQEKSQRTINQYGEKSQYIEKNEGDITIN